MNIQNVIQELQGAQTGDELLSILNALSVPNSSQVKEPTLDEIEF